MAEADKTQTFFHLYVCRSYFAENLCQEILIVSNLIIYVKNQS